MKPLLKRIVPAWQNALLALSSAGLLILAFPDFEYWFLAWFALVPLMWAIERDGGFVRSFVLGWLFGTAFFFGTCWWLTYAPIHYAAFPWPLAYTLILIVCLGAGTFPGVFAAILSVLLRCFGSWAFLAAPFVWVFSEFARYWLTGNNWNAIGYSQAFVAIIIPAAGLGGVMLLSFEIALFASALMLLASSRNKVLAGVIVGISVLLPVFLAIMSLAWAPPYTYVISGDPLGYHTIARTSSYVVAIQGNVPMSGLTQAGLEHLRQSQFMMIDSAMNALNPDDKHLPLVAVLPESPMNFMYNDDREFQQFAREFTTKNNVSLLFNSSEPDVQTGKYFNSAVMVGPDGRKLAQYDKVYLLPFGEAVPVPFDSVMPGFVGNFAYGRNYPLLPVGDAKAGVMICFESHFGALSREYVKNGADVIIEMTNDGYLGPTAVLRQHLANAVFRAVETNRPVLRVTNVGITAYITETGAVLDPAPTYTEATRVWSVSKSDGSQTLYVRFGDWFAWLCTAVTALFFVAAVRRRGSEKLKTEN